MSNEYIPHISLGCLDVHVCGGKGQNMFHNVVKKEKKDSTLRQLSFR